MKVKVKKVIRIGAHPYRLSFSPNLKIDNDFKGAINIRKQIIQIEPSLPSTQMAYVLLHELLEGITDAYTCGLSHEDLDRVAEGLASVLLNEFGIELDWGDIPIE